MLGTGFFSEFTAGISDLLGTKNQAMANKITYAKEHALELLRKKADAVGANAIIAVSVDVEVFGNNLFAISALGTAVIIDKDELPDL